MREKQIQVLWLFQATYGLQASSAMDPSSAKKELSELDKKLPAILKIIEEQLNNAPKLRKPYELLKISTVR